MGPVRRFGVLGVIVAIGAAWIPVVLLPAVASADPSGASITVVLDMAPDAPNRIDFTLYNPDAATTAGFLLDDDGGPAAGGNDNFVSSGTATDLVPGDYQLGTTIPPAGYSLAKLECDDPDSRTDRTTRSATVDLDAAEDITCTYTFTRQSITVVLDLVPDAPGALDVALSNLDTAFFWAQGLDDDGGPGAGGTNQWLPSTTAGDLVPGDYQLSSTYAPVGYSLAALECDDPDSRISRFDRSAWVDLDPAEHITCTYTWTKQAINVTIDLVPDAPGMVEMAFFNPDTFPVQSMQLDDDGGSAAGGTDQYLPSATAGDVAPGDYILSSTNPPSGYTLASVECDDPNSRTDRASRSATVDLDPAENVSCTFTYTLATADTDGDGQPDGTDPCPLDPNPAADCTPDVQRGSITLRLDVDPETDPSANLAFGFQGDLAAALEDDGDEFDSFQSSVTFVNLLPVQFQVSEQLFSGWTLASISCDDDGTIVSESTLTADIDLDPGEHVTCTWRTTSQAITLALDADPHSDPSANLAFQFNGDLFTGLEDDGDELDGFTSSVTFGNLLPVQFQVFEQLFSGWTLASITCDDSGSIVSEGNLTADIDLDPGEHVTCTWRTTSQAITLALDADPNSDPTADLAFIFTGDLFVTLEDDGDEFDGFTSSVTFHNLLPVQFQVYEQLWSSWTLASIVCDDSGTIVSESTLTADIDLDPGEHVTCTWRNVNPDVDADGVLNAADGCLYVPEDADGVADADGCPETDADSDGLDDTVDACPTSAEDFDGLADADGCPETDADGDGVADTADACPTIAEDLDGVMDADGCPETDADGDGINDTVDACPLVAEDLDGHNDSDGCPEAEVVAAIVFTSSRTGLGDVYAMAPDGTGQTRLTVNSAIDGEPAWSPDRTKIAFSSSRTGNGDIYVMNADGTGMTRLTTSSGVDFAPAWSPDGSKIAFASTRTGGTDLYVMNANGSAQTRLTTHGDLDSEPAWSPDGTKIAFTSVRTGNGDIYTMKSDGTNQTRRTTSSGIDASPAWSPDGTKIAFSSSRTGSGDIYVMNPDGTSQTRVTNHSAIDAEPAWSPDGSKIAFTSSRTGLGDIYVMNADGSTPTRLTTSTGIDLSPAWK